MRKAPLVLVGLFLAVFAFGQEEDVIPDFEMNFGPRVGASYSLMSNAEFTDLVKKYFPGDDYSPLQTVFGVNFEQRVLLGRTRNQFAFQEIVFVSGLEQSLFLPSAAFLIGYRDNSGFEFGFGPLASLNGISVLTAVGYTFKIEGVFIPVDLGVRIPSAKSPPVFSITTGFNFTFSKS